MFPPAAGQFFHNPCGYPPGHLNWLDNNDDYNSHVQNLAAQSYQTATTHGHLSRWMADQAATSNQNLHAFNNVRQPFLELQNNAIQAYWWNNNRRRDNAAEANLARNRLNNDSCTCRRASSRNTIGILFSIGIGLGCFVLYFFVHA